MYTRRYLPAAQRSLQLVLTDEQVKRVLDVVFEGHQQLRYVLNKKKLAIVVRKVRRQHPCVCCRLARFVRSSVLTCAVIVHALTPSLSFSSDRRSAGDPEASWRGHPSCRTVSE